MTDKSLFKEIFGADLGDLLEKDPLHAPKTKRHRIISNDGVITITGQFKKLVVNGRIVYEESK